MTITAERLKDIRDMYDQMTIEEFDEILKSQIKLKMMEISFEQINNSRNDMIRQLAECEIELGKKK